MLWNKYYLFFQKYKQDNNVAFQTSQVKFILLSSCLINKIFSINYVIFLSVHLGIVLHLWIWSRWCFHCFNCCKIMCKGFQEHIFVVYSWPKFSKCYLSERSFYSWSITFLSETLFRTFWYTILYFITIILCQQILYMNYRKVYFSKIRT